LVLSLQDGQVWARWSGGDAPVNLGDHDTVVEEMRYFMAQSEAAVRLSHAAKRQAERRAQDVRVMDTAF
jgi:hypothetical protein